MVKWSGLRDDPPGRTSVGTVERLLPVRGRTSRPALALADGRDDASPAGPPRYRSVPVALLSETRRAGSDIVKVLDARLAAGQIDAEEHARLVAEADQVVALSAAGDALADGRIPSFLARRKRVRLSERPARPDEEAVTTPWLAAVLAVALAVVLVLALSGVFGPAGF